jgi:hypothetical protein
MAVVVIVAAHAIAVLVIKSGSVQAAEDRHPQLAKITTIAMQQHHSHPNLKVVTLPSNFGFF